MVIQVKVIPGTSQNLVEKLSSSHYKVKLVAAPQKGRANKELLNLLANYFKIPSHHLTIKKGHKSPLKTIEIVP